MSPLKPLRHLPRQNPILPLGLLSWLCAGLLLPLAPGCASVRGSAAGTPSGVRLLSGADAERSSREAALEAALDSDVVFLGELHDNSPGHAFYDGFVAELLPRALAAGRTPVLSMEMFERDTQDLLDDYLAGRLGEPEFLAEARPWPNYKQHYRPLVERFRAAGLHVIAANVPRRVASRIGREGLAPGTGGVFTPAAVDLRSGDYKARFLAAMGDMAGHGQGMPAAALERFFAAQAVKDDAMAESIAEALRGAEAARPLVIHACGRFHSDYGLGTVERLRSRMPEVRVLVFSMAPDGEAERDAEAQPPTGDFILEVPGGGD